MAQTTIDFNDYASGTIVSDNYSSLGVHISSVARVDRGGNGDAMIFDTANVTGRDFDLAYDNQGSALIISEDGDSIDADDDRAGGTITFDFDAPSALTSLTVLDAEEGGLIEIYDDTGAKIGQVEIPPGSNNDSRVIDLPFDGVSKMNVTLNGSGAIDDLVFDPGVTMEPDDEITAEIQGTTADGSEVTFEIELPKDFDGTTSYLSASLLVGSGGDQTNVAFVVDVSGSTSDPFLGTAVGDVNNDFLSDTILDAEIASLLNLSSAIAGIGLQPDEIDVGLVTFSGSSSFEGEFEPGSTELSTALTSLSWGGNTNYAAGLQSTIDFFAANNAAGENNVVYFLSDGYPNVGGSFADEVQTLEDVYNAQIVAVGIGNGAALNELNEIDNTGGAEIVTSTDELDATLVDASTVGGAALEDFFVFVNGVEQTDIDETDLVASVFGYRLPLTEIDNLDPTAGVENTVVAQITLDDGTEFELTATLEGGGYLIEGELL